MFTKDPSIFHCDPFVQNTILSFSKLTDIAVKPSSSSLDRMTTSDPESSTSNPPRVGGNNAPLFPWKLHEMLQACAEKNKEGIASWVSNGNAFRVHDISIFVEEILPLFFNQTKYKSFQRQLNLWGFQRIHNGPERGAYHHKYFKREQPELCSRLSRQKSKKSSASATIKLLKPTSLSSKLSKRAPGWPIPSSLSTFPRNVSEENLESVGRSSSDGESSVDLADFDGATFHPLEQERYKELDLEFDFYSRQENQYQSNTRSGLLQELEMGLFGIPKMRLRASF